MTAPERYNILDKLIQLVTNNEILYYDNSGWDRDDVEESAYEEIVELRAELENLKDKK